MMVKVCLEIMPLLTYLYLWCIVFDEDELGEFSSNRTEDGELTAAKELGLMVCISYCMISCLEEHHYFSGIHINEEKISYVDGTVGYTFWIRLCI
jgi:hypothetical protein